MSDAKLEKQSERSVLTRLDWSLIQSFVAVVGSGNLTRAARQLNSTQPTIGRHIRRLEAEIGEILFDRVPGGLRPTARATEIYERALAVDQAVTGLRGSIVSQPLSAIGTVRVAASMTFAVEVLPPLLAPLIAEHSRLIIELVADDRVANLVSRDADVAVRLSQPTQPDLVAAKVCNIEVALFAHQSYLATRAAPKTIADLSDHVMIGYDDPLVTIDAARSLGAKLELDHIRFRSDTLLTQTSAISAGIGIGTCQVHLARQLPGFVRVLPDLVVAKLPLWMVAHEDVRRSHRIRLVFDHLLQELRHLHRSPATSSASRALR